MTDSLYILFGVVMVGVLLALFLFWRKKIFFSASTDLQMMMKKLWEKGSDNDVLYVSHVENPHYLLIRKQIRSGTPALMIDIAIDQWRSAARQRIQQYCDTYAIAYTHCRSGGETYLRLAFNGKIDNAYDATIHIFSQILHLDEDTARFYIKYNP